MSAPLFVCEDVSRPDSGGCRNEHVIGPQGPLAAIQHALRLTDRLASLSKERTERDVANSRGDSGETMTSCLRAILGAVVSVAESQQIDLERAVRCRVNAAALEAWPPPGGYDDKINGDENTNGGAEKFFAADAVEKSGEREDVACAPATRASQTPPSDTLGVCTAEKKEKEEKEGEPQHKQQREVTDCLMGVVSSECVSATAILDAPDVAVASARGAVSASGATAPMEESTKGMTSLVTSVGIGDVFRTGVSWLKEEKGNGEQLKVASSTMNETASTSTCSRSSVGRRDPRVPDDALFQNATPETFDVSVSMTNMGPSRLSSSADKLTPDVFVSTADMPPCELLVSSPSSPVVVRAAASSADTLQTDVVQGLKCASPSLNTATVCPSKGDDAGDLSRVNTHHTSVDRTSPPRSAFFLCAEGRGGGADEGAERNAGETTTAASLCAGEEQKEGEKEKADVISIFAADGGGRPLTCSSFSSPPPPQQQEERQEEGHLDSLALTAAIVNTSLLLKNGDIPDVPCRQDDVLNAPRTTMKNTTGCFLSSVHDMASCLLSSSQQTTTRPPHGEEGADEKVLATVMTDTSTPHGADNEKANVEASEFFVDYKNVGPAHHYCHYERNGGGFAANEANERTPTAPLWTDAHVVRQHPTTAILPSGDSANNRTHNDNDSCTSTGGDGGGDGGGGGCDISSRKEDVRSVATPVMNCRDVSRAALLRENSRRGGAHRRVVVPRYGLWLLQQLIHERETGRRSE